MVLILAPETTDRQAETRKRSCYNDFVGARHPRPSTLVTDLRRLRKLRRHAVAVGAILAIVCHLIPPHYRVVCDLLASLCGAGDR